MKHFKQLLCMALLFLLALPLGATEGKSGDFDPSSIVLGHIKDSYDWHVTDIGDKSVVIHLPIIVKSSTGWHVFSSSQFEEEADAKGYRHGPYGLAIASAGDHAGKIVELQSDGSEAVPLDISITKTVAVLFIDAILLLVCILIPARWARRHKASDAAPGGFVGFMEMLITYVEDNIVKPGVGEGYEKYSPYLLTCFFFIFTCNLMGVVPFPPGGGNVTGNITVTFFLALCTFIITQFSGTKHYWKDIFWPDVPTWLKAPVPLIPFIEFIGIFTKPFALMIRLFANMMAGHAIALALTCIIFLVVANGMVMIVGMSIVSVVMSVFMMCLELLVCFIQSMVFTMLSATFIGLARAKGE
ncbi:MAG: F0F1 ATP synthase subunit A [Bacteroidales bacterium]|nr:F0F1 ATP synthase subunit A [Bacteroidales bacterium]